MCIRLLAEWVCYVCKFLCCVDVFACVCACKCVCASWMVFFDGTENSITIFKKKSAPKTVKMEWNDRTTQADTAKRWKFVLKLCITAAVAAAAATMLRFKLNGIQKASTACLLLLGYIQHREFKRFARPQMYSSCATHVWNGNRYGWRQQQLQCRRLVLHLFSIILESLGSLSLFLWHMEWMMMWGAFSVTIDLYFCREHHPYVPPCIRSSTTVYICRRYVRFRFVGVAAFLHFISYHRICLCILLSSLILSLNSTG